MNQKLVFTILIGLFFSGVHGMGTDNEEVCRLVTNIYQSKDQEDQDRLLQQLCDLSIDLNTIQVMGRYLLPHLLYWIRVRPEIVTQSKAEDDHIAGFARDKIQAALRYRLTLKELIKHDKLNPNQHTQYLESSDQATLQDICREVGYEQARGTILWYFTTHFHDKEKQSDGFKRNYTFRWKPGCLFVDYRCWALSVVGIALFVSYISKQSDENPDADHEHDEADNVALT